MLKTRGDVIPIDRISRAEWAAAVRRGDTGRRPLVVDGAFATTVAVRSWTPDRIAARFADVPVQVAVGLPARGSPYSEPLRGHHRRMTMAEFARFMPDHPGSYLARAGLPGFPGLAQELGIAGAVVPPVLSENLWVGNSTQSGLHFDMGDGLLAQVYGVKTATLVAAGQFGSVYPYPDIHTKSRVDPDDFDERRHPRFAGVDRFAAVLQPGDALFIPRHWWHNLVSHGISVSVNAWFGRSRRRDLPLTMLRAGPAVWRQAARDFVNLGLRKRDFDKRLFVSKPSGLWLYELLAKTVRR
jgi:hypothetical protein